MAFKLKKIDVNGQKYEVHEISVRQRREIFSQHKESGDALEMSISLVLFGCVQFEGKDDEAVLDLPGTVFDAISGAVADVSGMGADDDEKKSEAG